MADHLEIEQKFDVDPDFRRPDFAGLNDQIGDQVTAAAPVKYQLSATYFDTADGRLAASKITLRRRTGGTDEGWHLKLPSAGAGSAAGVSSRLEVHAPLAPGAAEVPERLAARVAEVTGGLPLKPIATLDTERTVVTLTGRDGRVLAEIADDVVTARRLPPTSEPLSSEPPTSEPLSSEPLSSEPLSFEPLSFEPLRWREIEVEVPAPGAELQRAAADLLFAAGARPAGHGSKLARLLSG